MNETVFEKGRTEGRTEGKLAVIQAILESKFKSLPPGVMDRVRLMSDDQIHQLAVAIPAAETLADLGL